MTSKQKLNVSRVLSVDSINNWDTLIHQAHVNSSTVVVHFTADWCAPSRFMEAHFKELSLKFYKLMFLLVDVDEFQELCSNWEVKAMPTFVIIQEEKEVHRIVGANNDELGKAIASFANSSPTQSNYPSYSD